MCVCVCVCVCVLCVCFVCPNLCVRMRPVVEIGSLGAGVGYVHVVMSHAADEVASLGRAHRQMHISEHAHD